jgi:hypothetical protein
MKPMVVIRRNFLGDRYNVLIEGEGLPKIAANEPLNTHQDICKWAYQIALRLGLPIGIAESYDGAPEEVDPESVEEVAQGGATLHGAPTPFERMVDQVRSMYGKTAAKGAG